MVRHTEFGIPYLLSLTQFPLFEYEIISEMCNSKSYTVLWENKFFSLNVSEMYSVGKASSL